MNQPIDVHLTWDEVLSAALIGVFRQLHALKEGRKERHGRTKRTKGAFQCHIEGATGELIIAKVRNIYWNGTIGKVTEDDVGPYQVRTRAEHHRDMVLHLEDADHKKFVCVTGGPRDYKVWGWLYGHEGKKHEYYDEVTMRAPLYIVPKSILRPMETLDQ